MRTRRDVWLAYATTAVGISAVSLIAPVLPELADLYGISVGEVAAIQVAVLVPGIVSARWLLGRGADGGLQRMLGVALLGYGLAGSSLLWLMDFPLVLLARLIQGFFCGGLVAGAFALLSGSGEGRDRRIAGNAALVCLMMALQPLLGSALSVLGARGPFLFYTAGVPLGLLLLRLQHASRVRFAPPVVPVSPRASGPPATVSEALTTTVVINCLLFGWLLYLGPVLLAEEYDLGVGIRGLVVSGQAALGAVLALGVAGLLRRGRQRQLLYAGMAVPVLGLGVVLTASTYFVAVLGFVAVGFTYGTANPAVISILTARGRRATGAWQSSARVGQVVGPVVAGWLVMRRSLGEVLLVGIGLGVLGLLRLLLSDVAGRRAPASPRAPGSLSESSTAPGSRPS